MTAVSPIPSSKGTLFPAVDEPIELEGRVSAACSSKRLEERLLVDIGMTKDPTNRVSAHRPMKGDSDEVPAIGMDELPMAPLLALDSPPEATEGTEKTTALYLSGQTGQVRGPP